jgi:hypothetical protein
MRNSFDSEIKGSPATLHAFAAWLKNLASGDFGDVETALRRAVSTDEDWDSTAAVSFRSQAHALTKVASSLDDTLSNEATIIDGYADILQSCLAGTEKVRNACRTAGLEVDGTIIYSSEYDSTVPPTPSEAESAGLTKDQFNAWYDTVYQINKQNNAYLAALQAMANIFAIMDAAISKLQDRSKKLAQIVIPDVDHVYTAGSDLAEVYAQVRGVKASKAQARADSFRASRDLSDNTMTRMDSRAEALATSADALEAGAKAAERIGAVGFAAIEIFTDIESGESFWEAFTADATGALVTYLIGEIGAAVGSYVGPVGTAVGGMVGILAGILTEKLIKECWEHRLPTYVLGPQPAPGPAVPQPGRC